MHTTCFRASRGNHDFGGSNYHPISCWAMLEDALPRPVLSKVVALDTLQPPHLWAIDLRLKEGEQLLMFNSIPPQVSILFRQNFPLFSIHLVLKQTIFREWSITSGTKTKSLTTLIRPKVQKYWLILFRQSNQMFEKLMSKKRQKAPSSLTHSLQRGSLPSSDFHKSTCV